MPRSSILQDIYYLSFLGWDEIEALMLREPKRQRKLYVSSRGGLLNIEAIPDRVFRRQFRFEKADFPLLLMAPELPQYLSSAQGVRITGYEALCMCLRRLAYPNRLCDLQEYFARHYSVISSVTNKVMWHIERKFGFLLDDLTVHKWLTTEDLKAMSEAVYLNGAPLKNCWAFIDATVLPICRPSKVQRTHFSGHKRLHALKYQSLMCPNGLICELDGPYPGSKHDADPASTSTSSTETYNSRCSSCTDCANAISFEYKQTRDHKEASNGKSFPCRRLASAPERSALQGDYTFEASIEATFS
ncbi:hypothetical protein HPB49_010261 [Dermacentor silvarum]|uniref:Uncharacterized protein n=1 Tax=Dermacentor silvarum TaxID=543639 RepID=A0ACB8DCG2_DERSI|nr:hypothetical protein HPB49_010261 [Dermacentor silvarum]